MTVGDGLGNNVDLNDQYVIGTFEASGSSQSLQLIANGFPNVNLNGYQLRAITSVPEPSIGIALAFATLGLTRRRRSD